MMRLLLAATILTGLVSGLIALPDAPDAASHAMFYAAADRFQLLCRLTVDDGTGDTKVRELRVSTRRDGGDERFLTQVTAPASLKNLKFLRIKTKEGTGAWLKTSRGVQRLAPEGDPEPLFGSDFTTADFQPGSKDWTEGTGTPETIVLERATEPRLGWVRQILTLRKADLLILNSDFLAANGAAVRRYSVTAFSAEGRPRTVRLEDLKNQRHSVLEILAEAVNQDLPASLFAPGNL